MKKFLSGAVVVALTASTGVCRTWAADPVTPPTSATAPAVVVDCTTPPKTLHSMFEAFKAGDLQRLEACLLLPTDRTLLANLETNLQRELAPIRVYLLLAAQFGPAGAKELATAQAPVDLTANAFAATPIHITGNTAFMTLPLPPTPPGTPPPPAETIEFQKVGDAWKISRGPMYYTGAVPPAMQKFFAAQDQVFVDVTAAIKAGQYKDPAAAEKDLDQRLQAAAKANEPPPSPAPRR